MANENNYFEFLDIPDGSGGTERWYAKDAEARAAIAQLDPASVIEVADITALTSAQVEALVVGGAVNKSDSTGKHSYHVTYKSDTGCCLTYYDAENIETVAYEKENDEWGYLDTTYARVSNIPNKADKIGSGHNNEIAAYNTTGNLKASGVTISDIQEAQTDINAMLDAIGTDTSIEFVDLGLPSGTLWAKCNIGADSETGYGNYYMYGSGNKKYISTDEPYTGTENPLDSTKDTATVILGAPWHMPTRTQLQELVDNTTYTSVQDFEGSGVNGGLFTAQNGNYIFLPFAGKFQDGAKDGEGMLGIYCGSTPDGSDSAYRLNITNGYKAVGSSYRYYGHSVRPVCDSAPLNKLRFASVAESTAAANELT